MVLGLDIKPDYSWYIYNILSKDEDKLLKRNIQTNIDIKSFDISK